MAKRDETGVGRRAGRDENFGIPQGVARREKRGDEVSDEPDKPVTQSNVDHPAHYQGNGIEVIDVIESFDLSFRLGNAVKYILRAGRKREQAS